MRRGSSGQHEAFSYVVWRSGTRRHPLQTISARAKSTLKRLSPLFAEIYPSGIAHRFRRAAAEGAVADCAYSVRSNRQLCENLAWNLLFRWFLGVTMNGRICAVNLQQQP